MLSAMAHYGPDRQDCAAVDDVSLGRALFQLLPEDRFDRQPLGGGGGRYLLAADLRLDNRSDLAAVLGIDAATATRMADAELLLAAWERWQDDVFPHLAGDYAFVLFDRVAQALTMAVDPLGERPLFWTRYKGGIAAASMPVGLHALPDIPHAPDAGRAARLLAGLNPGDRSFFTGIRRVRAGHRLRFTREGLRDERHWEPRREKLRLPRFEDYVLAYREQLDRAVGARLRRIDRPLAAHLSGGWDSGCVVGTAARLLGEGERLTAFTAVPATPLAEYLPSRFSDEAPQAAAVAAMHDAVNHVAVAATGASPLAALNTHPALYGRPLVNLCNHVWLADIRRRASAGGAHVVLTGEIGNFTVSFAPATLLADYLRTGRLARWAQEAALAVRSGRARPRGVLATSFEPWMPRWAWRRLDRFASVPSVSGLAGLAPAWGRRLADEFAAADRARRRRGHFDARVYGLQAGGMAEYHKGVLGGWGIDKRDPTADIRLVEFMLSLPDDMFLRAGRRRPLAHAALADRLPPAVLDERRKGYQAADWHVGLDADRATAAALVDAIVADPLAADVLDTALLRRMIDDWPNGHWQAPETVARYRGVFLNTLSVGHFLIHG